MPIDGTGWRLFPIADFWLELRIQQHSHHHPSSTAGYLDGIGNSKLLSLTMDRRLIGSLKSSILAQMLTGTTENAFPEPQICQRRSPNAT